MLNHADFGWEFPLWFMSFWLPPFWIFMIVYTFILTSLTVLILLKISGVHALQIYLKIILSVSFFSLLGQFVFPLLFAGLCLIDSVLPEPIWESLLFRPNLFENLFSTACAAIALLISIFFTFHGVKFSFRKTDISKQQKFLLALCVAAITAPYFYLIPL